MERSQWRSTRREGGLTHTTQVGLSRLVMLDLLHDRAQRWRFTALLALWALWDLLWEAIAHG